MRGAFWCGIALLATGALGATQAMAGNASPRLTSAPPTMLVVELAFDGERANSVQPGDAESAHAASARLRAMLRGASDFALADSADAAIALARGDRPGLPCTANRQCAREAARALGARWVVMGTVSKTSNLIWYLSAQLIDAESGRTLLDDGFELKGPRDDLIPRGAESLARRITTAARRDLGRATN